MAWDLRADGRLQRLHHATLVARAGEELTRYKCYIEYEGTRYKGWQRQPGSRTVEEEIEEGLSQILQQQIDLVGQGRTDRGVHAEAQIAHADLPDDADPEKLQFGLLGVLPRDIAVWRMEKVDTDFHARFHARSRTYRYQILRRPSPLLDRFATRVMDHLDLEKMLHCAEYIHGEHDFETFTKSDPDGESNTRCEILASDMEWDDTLITWRITANRFLRHMVRRLAGTVIQVGQGKRTYEEFSAMVDKPNKNRGGHGAKARGLILESVEYGT
ncbi:MAG: tRNA pseudouridine(38-40) synthase TruA [Balneolaceae bacterium]|nr:tRNA pseudouridine(38-40) synthase TruA [Balneolaceae bacterium]